MKLMKAKLCNTYLLLISLITASLISSCSRFDFQPAPKDPIRIYYDAWPGDYPLVLADALGYYEKYGLDAELIYLKSNSSGFMDFLNSKVDTISTTLIDALLIAQTEDIQIVWLQDNPLDTLVSIPTITSPADLLGKRIGVDMRTGAGELFIESLLENNNMTLADVTLIHTPSDGVPGALGKEIDAGFTSSPYISEAIAAGNKILVQLPSLSPNVMIFKTSLVNERPDAVRTLVEAWSEAVLYWEANPTDSIELIASYFDTQSTELSLGVEEGIDTYSRQQNQDAFTPSSTNSIFEVAEVNLDYLVKAGRIWRLLDIPKIFNGEFVGRLDGAN